MPKIFLCYRREDSSWAAGVLRHHLSQHFGADSVFRDIDSTPLGADFREHIKKEISKCDVLLAVIGDQWLDFDDNENVRRIDSTDDFVRLEIESALARPMPVIPILVGRTPMPKEGSLPASIARLAYHQAHEVRSGREQPFQLATLTQGIEALLSLRNPQPKTVPRLNLSISSVASHLRAASIGRLVVYLAMAAMIIAGAPLWELARQWQENRQRVATRPSAPPPSQATIQPAEQPVSPKDVDRQRPVAPLRPTMPAENCDVLRKFSSEEWKRQFIGTSFPDTWMVYVASGSGSASAAEAAQIRSKFEIANPTLAFAAIPTISRKDDNERFGIAIALGLADPEVADRLVWLARHCGVAKDAFQYQQR